MFKQFLHRRLIIVLSHCCWSGLVLSFPFLKMSKMTGDRIVYCAAAVLFTLTNLVYVCSILGNLLLESLSEWEVRTMLMFIITNTKRKENKNDELTKKGIYTTYHKRAKWHWYQNDDENWNHLKGNVHVFSFFCVCNPIRNLNMGINTFFTRKMLLCYIQRFCGWADNDVKNEGVFRNYPVSIL